MEQLTSAVEALRSQLQTHTEDEQHQFREVHRVITGTPDYPGLAERLRVQEARWTTLIRLGWVTVPIVIAGNIALIASWIQSHQP